MKREAHAHRCRYCRQMYVCNDTTCRGAKADVCENTLAGYSKLKSTVDRAQRRLEELTVNVGT